MRRFRLADVDRSTRANPDDLPSVAQRTAAGPTNRASAASCRARPYADSRGDPAYEREDAR